MGVCAILGIFMPDDWAAVFLPDTPILEIVARGSVIYLTLFFGLRFVMKREAAGIAISDLLVVVLLADAVQNGMAGDYTSVSDGILLGATVIGWDWLLSYLAFRSPKVRRVIRPQPIILIRDGKPVQQNIDREMLTHEEIMGQLREQGIERIEEVKIAYMESNGLITAIPKGGSGGEKTRSPVTP